MLSPNQIARFFKYHEKYLGYKVSFLNIVKCLWRLQFDHLIFFGFSQACTKCSAERVEILMKDLVHLVLNNTPPLRIYKNDMVVLEL